MIPEQLLQDYSNWLETIPEQLGWTISDGNRIFDRLQNKELKKLSKKYSIDIEILIKYYK